MAADAAVHLPSSVVLLIVALAALGAISRAIEWRARARRTEARKQRQREYRRYLRTEGWKERRKVALDRAGGFCEDCGARGNLDVHHRTYVRKGAERPEDLVALCRECHDERHRGKRNVIDWIVALLRRWRIWRYRSTEI